MENSNKTELRYLCISQIKMRGWTDSIIKKLLGPHDLEKENPIYKYAKPMKLYLEERVLKTEETEEFKVLKEKSKTRSEAGKKVQDKKRQDFFNYIRNLNIHIPEYDYEHLVELACDSYNDFQKFKAWRRGDYYSFDEPATSQSDEKFIARICMNYLRHNCTRYDKELEKMFGKTGRAEGHDIIQNRINQEICRIYPEIKKHYPQYDTSSNVKNDTHTGEM